MKNKSMDRRLKKSRENNGLFINLLELVFPKRCPGCDEILSYTNKQRGFCRKCERKIRFAGEDTCMKCGHPLLDKNKEFCQACESKNRRFDRGFGIYTYKGPMKEAMYRFKYSNRRCYGRTFARDGARIYRKWIERNGINLIVPVPMYEKKKRKRGYNQAEVVALALSAELNIPCKADCVKRIRTTAPMKNLTGEERKHNLENAFKLSENGVKFKKVLLIDDIYTTGSTMEAVADLLKKAGAEKVYCLSVCIGDEY